MPVTYKVGVIEIPDNCIVTIPDNATPLNAFYHPNSGKRLLTVVELIGPVSEEEEKESKG